MNCLHVPSQITFKSKLRVALRTREYISFMAQFMLRYTNFRKKNLFGSNYKQMAKVELLCEAYSHGLETECGSQNEDCTQGIHIFLSLVSAWECLKKTAAAFVLHFGDDTSCQNAVPGHVRCADVCGIFLLTFA